MKKDTAMNGEPTCIFAKIKKVVTLNFELYLTEFVK